MIERNRNDAVQGISPRESSDVYGRPAILWGYLAPTTLWAGSMIAFPLLQFLPDSFDLPALLGCLAGHTLGGCWMLYRLRGRRDLSGIRTLVALPTTVVFILSLWAMRTDDLAYDGAVVSGVMALIIWLMFAATRLAPPAE
jgi:hypothetical protein